MSHFPAQGEDQYTSTEQNARHVKLLEGLRSLPPGAEVSFPAGQLVGLIEEEVRTRMGLDAIEWVGIGEAAETLPESPRTIRRRAEDWLAQMESGKRPPVRVRKKSDKKRSDWQFARQDLLRQVRHHQETEQSKPATRLPETGDLDEFLEVA